MDKQEQRLARQLNELREFLLLRHYKLDENRNPIPCESFEEAAEWFDTVDRQVRLTCLSGNVHVSTVFLAVDHNWRREGPPLTFETAIFREDGATIFCRYSTWDDAEKGHDDAVSFLCETERRKIEELDYEDPLDAEFVYDEVQKIQKDR